MRRTKQGNPCPRCGEIITTSSWYTKRNHERSCSDAVCLHDAMTMDMEEDANLVDAEEDDNLVDDAHEPSATPDVHDLDNFDHMTQFLRNGRCGFTDSELQLLKFVHMAHDGYGVSRHFSEGMLLYCRRSGGQNTLLPDTWKRCVVDTTSLIEKLTGERKTFSLNVPIPQKVRDMLADPSQSHISFEFECPITELIRVAMFSKTCKSWDNVALSYEANGGYLDDFCNGDRYKRIAEDMRPGSAILGAVLATDGICLDKCMFDSQEVSVV